jgi:hypothetical protein
VEGIRDALTFQEDGFDRLESSGLFRVPANPFDADGETLEAEYSRIFHENSRLMDDYLKKIFTFQDASQEYETAAAEFLAFLDEVETEAAGVVDSIAANAGPIQTQAWLTIGVSLLLCIGASIYSAHVMGRAINVTSTMTDIAESTNSLTTSISESTTASCEISQNVTGVDVESRQTATGAGSTRTANSKLQSLATDLQEMVADFTV